VAAVAEPRSLREEMVNLQCQGWTEKRIAQLLRCSRKTVMKWLRRARHTASQPDSRCLWLLDLSSPPHRTARKVYFGAMHAVLRGLSARRYSPCAPAYRKLTREMTEASLAIARKVILCVGLLVSALLLLVPALESKVYSQ
jgi:hypothetical protein